MIGRRLLLTGLASLPAVAACSSKETPAVDIGNPSAPDDYYGSYMPEGWELPDVTLTDQHGRPYNIRTGWDTKAVALFFGYLNCPDVCPGIMADMASARRRLDPAIADEITPILVTTDPARDDEAALKAYLERVDERFVGLTGELGEIVALGQQLHIAIEKGKQLPSGGYEVDHSTQVLGVASDKQVHVVWTTLGLDVGRLREDYARLIRGE